MQFSGVLLVILVMTVLTIIPPSAQLSNKAAFSSFWPTLVALFIWYTTFAAASDKP